MWALGGVRQLCWPGSPVLEWRGQGFYPGSGPGSLLPYVPQSQVPRDWIGAGAVFHSPEVLGSRGESCVGPCGCQATPLARKPGAGVERKGWFILYFSFKRILVIISVRYSYMYMIYSGLSSPPHIHFPPLPLHPTFFYTPLALHFF